MAPRDPNSDKNQVQTDIQTKKREDDPRDERRGQPRIQTDQRSAKAIKELQEEREKEIEKRMRAMNERQDKRKEERRKEMQGRFDEQRRRARRERELAQQTVEEGKVKEAVLEKKVQAMNERQAQSGATAAVVTPGSDIRQDARYQLYVAKNSEQEDATNRALNEFKKEHPEEYQTYSQTIYDNPEDDPEWIALNERAEVATAAQLAGSTANEQEKSRIYASNLREETIQFVEQHEEKARTYAEHDPLIKAHVREIVEDTPPTPPPPAPPTPDPASGLERTKIYDANGRKTDGIKEEEEKSTMERRIEARKKEKEDSPSRQIILRYRQDKAMYDSAQAQDNVVRDFRETVDNAGLFNLSEADREQLQEAHPELDFTDTAFATGSLLASRGVMPSAITNAAQAAGDNLTAYEQEYFGRIGQVMEIVYQANPQYYEIIQSLPQPEVSFEIQTAPQTFTQTYMPIDGGGIDTAMAFNSFSGTAGNAVQPLVNAGSRAAQNKARSMLTRKVTTGAAKKGAEKVVKKGAKVVASKGLKGLVSAASNAILPFLGAALSWLGLNVLGFINRHAKDLAQAAGGLALAAGQFGGALFSGIVALITLAILALTTPLLIALFVVPFSVALILFIINAGAWVVPVGNEALFEGEENTDLPVECQGPAGPAPSVSDVRFSSDGQYAFPVAPFSQTYYSCGHWDGNKSVDIGIVGYNTGAELAALPVVAYTSGTITYVNQNDSIGGKNFIITGDDGRYYYHAHNCQIYVTRGQRVSAGQVVATTDTTGSAFGTPEHLHFAINTNSDTFGGGDGDVCPSTDFQEKFNLFRCAESQQCP